MGLKRFMELVDLQEKLDGFYKAKRKEAVDEFRAYFQALKFEVLASDESEVASYKDKISISLISDGKQEIVLKNIFLGTVHKTQVQIERDKSTIYIGHRYRDELDQLTKETENQIAELSEGKADLIYRSEDREYKSFKELLEYYY